MFCIIIQRANGKLIRETVQSYPDLADIEYWEDYHSVLISEGTIESAVVVNVYEVKD